MFPAVRFLLCASLFAGVAMLPLEQSSATEQQINPSTISGPPTTPGPPTIPWTWSSLPDLYPLVDLTTRQGHEGFSLHEDLTPKNSHSSTATLVHFLDKGGVRIPVWKVTLPDPGADELAGAAMVRAGTQVFIARYNRIASGCTLYAFAVADGKLQWKVFLQGIGPIAHSKWYNRVQVSVVGEHPVVFGNEGPTRGYIEQRDAATGAMIANQRLNGIPPIRPLAEPLYAEIQNMLRQQPTYQVKVLDFVQRHVMNRAVLAELSTAVQQIDGLPVQFGRYVIAAQLRTLPTGEQVVETKRR